MLKTCQAQESICFKASINIKRGTGYQGGLMTETRPALGLWNQMRVSLEPLAARTLGTKSDPLTAELYYGEWGPREGAVSSSLWV